jgi:hypothetical protein
MEAGEVRDCDWSESDNGELPLDTDALFQSIVDIISRREGIIESAKLSAIEEAAELAARIDKPAVFQLYMITEEILHETSEHQHTATHGRRRIRSILTDDPRANTVEAFGEALRIGAEASRRELRGICRGTEIVARPRSDDDARGPVQQALEEQQRSA